jgi:hypothetical protein
MNVWEIAILSLVKDVPYPIPRPAIAVLLALLKIPRFFAGRGIRIRTGRRTFGCSTVRLFGSSAEP